MAAPLETLDQIRDALIGRGIGSSGLTQQAIQRANLADLSTSLATAKSIQSEQQRRKEFEARSLAARQFQENQGRKRTPFLKVGIVPNAAGTDLQPQIKGGEGIGGVFVTSGQIPQFSQDIKNILAGSGGGVQIEGATGTPNIDSLLQELRAALSIAGAKVI